MRDIPGEAPWGPGATGTAEWAGARLADVLADAGLAPEATHVELIGADTSHDVEPPSRFGASIARHQALTDEVLLAWEMNGQPLTPSHGAPLRVVVPGYIGARSVKWLTDIVACDHPSENPFQAQAYRLLPADAPPESAAEQGVALGSVAVNCDFLLPGEGETVPGSPMTAEGYAFAATTVTSPGRGTAPRRPSRPIPRSRSDPRTSSERVSSCG